ncbi:MAG: flavodoxin family protein [Candidatus Omnitrophica bacterium]|nr:flavodoxin family protein [Candidatus Omnitrophota bacterium]
MHILAINGSPRKGGNTDMILDKILAGASANGASCTKIMLNDLKISPCQECEKQNKNGECGVSDDMQMVFDKIGKADVVVLGSPIFFGSLSAQTKCMIDRFQCLWKAKYIYGTVDKSFTKKGVFAAVSASLRQDFFDNAKMITKNFFATIGAKYSHEIFCAGPSEKGDVLQYTECMEKAFELGKEIAATF